ncbi:MAG: SPOR domain-containing protein, partial [Gammaproteobacteria bacterium]
KLAEFQKQGVSGEIERTLINDKPMYRVRVTGFETSRAARNSIRSLEDTLGLKGVWISRR